MTTPNPQPAKTGYTLTYAGRTIRIYLDPALEGQDTPLRRVLRQAGLLGPHGIEPSAAAPADPDQEN